MSFENVNRYTVATEIDRVWHSFDRDINLENNMSELSVTFLTFAWPIIVDPIIDTSFRCSSEKNTIFSIAMGSLELHDSRSKASFVT